MANLVFSGVCFAAALAYAGMGKSGFAAWWLLLTGINLVIGCHNMGWM